MQRPLLITGGSGYLGRRLVSLVGNAANDPGGSREVVATSSARLDVTDADAVRDLVRELVPAAVIHTAAVNPGPGRTESLMEAVNVEGSRHVAAAAREVGARLVHVSTDVVFDGRKGEPYVEEDPPTVTAGYGGSKARAEAAVAAADPGAAIVRTSLIYGPHGPDEMDRGTRGFAERLAAGEPVRLFSDVLRQPIAVDTLANALLALAFDAADYRGVLNVAGRQILSREAFGRRLLEWWQVPGRERVEAIEAASLPKPPPLDLRLDCSRAEALLDTTFPGVDEVLAAARRVTPF